MFITTKLLKFTAFSSSTRDFLFHRMVKLIIKNSNSTAHFQTLFLGSVVTPCIFHDMPWNSFQNIASTDRKRSPDVYNRVGNFVDMAKIPKINRIMVFYCSQTKTTKRHNVPEWQPGFTLHHSKLIFWPCANWTRNILKNYASPAENLTKIVGLAYTYTMKLSKDSPLIVTPQIRRFGKKKSLSGCCLHIGNAKIEYIKV